MKKTKKTRKILFPKYLFIPILALVFLGAGCRDSKTVQNDGGVFLSKDSGATWEQRVVLPTKEGVKSLGRVDAIVLEIDPTDNRTLYAGTLANGAFVSNNYGETWSSLPVSAGIIRAIEADPNSRCSIFVSTGRETHKSTDCGRSFIEIFTTPNGGIEVRKILVDRANSNNVYIGLSNGDLIQSLDGGINWRTNARFSSRITDIVQNPFNPDIILVSTEFNGLKRAFDRGQTWDDLTGKISAAVSGGKKNTSTGYAVIYDPVEDGLIYYASKLGILKSPDDGETWDIVPLLSAPGEARIYNLAVNSLRNKEIWYSATIGERPILYKSIDGGKNWDIIKIPTSRIPLSLTMDGKNPDWIYFGTYLKPKKK